MSPALILYIAFIGVPLVGLVVVSFLQWDLISPAHLAGLNNYRHVVHDPNLGQVLTNTFLLDIMTTALHLVLGMGLALAVTTIRARAVRYWARTAIVTPFLMSAGTVALMWSYVLNGQTGPFNYYLAKLGISAPNWLGSSTWGIPGLVIVDVWATLGFTFIIFLVGLQTIPVDLYEAAAIDGAGGLAKFRRITLAHAVAGHVYRLDHRLYRGVRDIYLAAHRHQRGPGDSDYDNCTLHLQVGFPELPVRLQRRRVAHQYRYIVELRCSDDRHR